MRQGGDVPVTGSSCQVWGGSPMQETGAIFCCFLGTISMQTDRERRASTPSSTPWDAGVAGSCLTPRATHVSLAQCVLQHQGQESGLAMLVCQSMCDPAPAANASLPTSRRRMPSSSSQNPATHAGDLELAPCS